ncbi:MAG: hypothetical protein HQK50_18275 [Oligoflexia bacterium]|nr:hypothetical protein [Oligoflexia bacterium]
MKNSWVSIMLRACCFVTLLFSFQGVNANEKSECLDFASRTATQYALSWCVDALKLPDVVRVQHQGARETCRPYAYEMRALCEGTIESTTRFYNGSALASGPYYDRCWPSTTGSHRPMFASMLLEACVFFKNNDSNPDGANPEVTLDSCVGDAVFYGEYFSKEYCYDKLKLSPIQWMFLIPKECQQYVSKMKPACQDSFHSTAVNSNGKLFQDATWNGEATACKRFTQGLYSSEYKRNMTEACTFFYGEDDTPSTQPDPATTVDLVKNCVKTSVKRSGRGSNVQLENSCSVSVKVSKLNVFWGDNIQEDSMGVHALDVIVPAKSDVTTIFRVGQNRLLRRWDFKYEVTFAAANAAGPQHLCSFWANEPDVTVRVCQ